jgi:hypothetical protein
MRATVTHAYPADFGAAAAGHVVAAAVLLDGLVAAGAGLGVDILPGRVGDALRHRRPRRVRRALLAGMLQPCGKETEQERKDQHRARESEMERERESEMERDRGKREQESKRERERESERAREKESERDTQRQKESEMERESERERVREIHRHTDTQTHRHTPPPPHTDTQTHTHIHPP